MNAYLKEVDLRVFYCDCVGGKVAQKLYGENSLGEGVWGCITKCPYIWCVYNLNPEEEAFRYNVYGRTSIW